MPTELEPADLRDLRHKARAAVLDALRERGGEASRRELIADAVARGAFTAHQREAPGPAAKADRYPTRLEHELSWTLSRLKRDGLVENPRWSTWRLAGAAAEPMPRPLLHGDRPSADRIAALDAMPYRDYLRSPEWRRTRAAAILRAEGACSLDATHTAGLEVHHRSYPVRGTELASDVVVLCSSCHAAFHAEHGRPGPRPAGAPARPSFLRRLLRA